jgi:hypothetical protein
MKVEPGAPRGIERLRPTFGRVVEAAETIGLPLKDLHLGVKTFGDAIVAGETPHRSDLIAPRLECDSSAACGMLGSRPGMSGGYDALVTLLSGFGVAVLFSVAFCLVVGLGLAIRACAIDARRRGKSPSPGDPVCDRLLPLGPDRMARVPA